MLLFKLGLAFCLIGATFGTCCMDYWTAYNGKCYRYFNLGKDWYDAEYYCLTMGAHLVGINDRAENDFVSYITAGADNDHGRGHVVWIGFHDIDEEGLWWHIDGTFYGFHNWALGEPNNQNDEDCAEFNMAGRGLWNDENCYVKRRFVCESYE